MCESLHSCACNIAPVHWSGAARPASFEARWFHPHSRHLKARQLGNDPPWMLTANDRISHRAVALARSCAHSKRLQSLQMPMRKKKTDHVTIDYHEFNSGIITSSQPVPAQRSGSGLSCQARATDGKTWSLVLAEAELPCQSLIKTLRRGDLHTDSNSPDFFGWTPWT